MRVGLALIVVILNVAAITSILGSRIAAGRKAAWCAGVVVLPIVGALGWFTARNRSRGA